MNISTFFKLLKNIFIFNITRTISPNVPLSPRKAGRSETLLGFAKIVTRAPWVSHAPQNSSLSAFLGPNGMFFLLKSFKTWTAAISKTISNKEKILSRNVPVDPKLMNASPIGGMPPEKQVNDSAENSISFSNL